LCIEIWMVLVWQIKDDSLNLPNFLPLNLPTIQILYNEKITTVIIHTCVTCTCHIVCRYVCISLEASEDTDVVLALSYVVSSASWSPQYDLRVFSNDKTMKASYNYRPYTQLTASTHETFINF